MTTLKCSVCGDTAAVMLEGSTLCYLHWRESLASNEEKPEAIIITPKKKRGRPKKRN